jgi:hypothetical protein
VGAVRREMRGRCLVSGSRVGDAGLGRARSGTDGYLRFFWYGPVPHMYGIFHTEPIGSTLSSNRATQKMGWNGSVPPDPSNQTDRYSWLQGTLPARAPATRSSGQQDRVAEARHAIPNFSITLINFQILSCIKFLYYSD